MILNAATRLLLEQLKASLPQSLLLTGPEGIGFKGAIDVLSSSHPLLYSLTPLQETGSKAEPIISVEAIRSLYEYTSRRHTDIEIIVINDADRMTISAQNAFLKLLEEPGQYIHFILVSHHPERLLPTIRSRVNEVGLLPITKEQSNELLEALKVHDEKKKQQLLFMAAGLPALLTRLVQDNDLFETRSGVIRDARLCLQGSLYESLQCVERYKERDRARLLIVTMEKLLRQNVTNHNASTIERKLENLMTVEEALVSNGNLRLWLTQAVL